MRGSTRTPASPPTRCHTILSACLTHLCSLLPLCLSLSHCPIADAISGWTSAEQDAWIADPIGPAEFHHCIGAVDATYVRIQRPKRYADERRLYSTYKKYHAVFFICILDRAGQHSGDSDTDEG